MGYKWIEQSPLSNGSLWLALEGHKDALVRITPDAKGEHVWQYGRRGGTLPTIEEAKAAVEAVSDYVSIPPDQRWFSL